MQITKYSVEISEDPMFLGNKLPRSDARRVNSQTDKLVSYSLSFLSYNYTMRFIGYDSIHIR